jgi:hypothetical protein
LERECSRRQCYEGRALSKSVEEGEGEGDEWSVLGDSAMSRRTLRSMILHWYQKGSSGGSLDIYTINTT